MSYKSLFTVAMADGDDALGAAISAAHHFGAHLDVTCLAEAQLDVPAMMAPEIAISGAAIRAEAAAELERTAKRVQERLSGEGIAYGISARPHGGADLIRHLAQTGRYADLAVLPASSRAGRMTLEGVLESMLYNTRVPILIAPKEARVAFDTITLAWDGSDVALAAARAALPILRTAGTVRIVTVSPTEDSSAETVAAVLARHGISVEIDIRPRNGLRIAEVLVAHAREMGADLMIMGAYGHRRLREVLIGGVTRELLQNAPIPLLTAR